MSIHDGHRARLRQQLKKSGIDIRTKGVLTAADAADAILEALKKKNKKESEVKFPKTDTRQSEKKEDICCYTELPKSKKPLSLKEKLLKNRFIGGR